MLYLCNSKPNLNYQLSTVEKMEDVRYKQKLYMLRLTSCQRSIFGGFDELDSDQLDVFVKAIENDINESKRLRFEHPKNGTIYERHYVYSLVEGMVILHVGRFRKNNDYASMVLHLNKCGNPPYVVLIDYEKSFGNEKMLVEIVERAFNWALNDKGVRVVLDKWDMSQECIKTMWNSDYSDAQILAKRKHPEAPVLRSGYEKIKPMLEKIRLREQQKHQKHITMKRTRKTYIEYIEATDEEMVLYILHGYADKTDKPKRAIMGQRVLMDLKMRNESIPHPVFTEEFGDGKGRDSSSYSTYLNSLIDYSDDPLYKKIYKSLMPYKLK